MKKFATALVSVLAVVVLALTMAACSKVDGKTYVYESYEVDGEKVTEMDEMMKDTGYKFDDGKVYMVVAGEALPVGTEYTQKGKTVTIKADGEEMKLTVKGSKLIAEETVEGKTVKVTYVKK